MASLHFNLHAAGVLAPGLGSLAQLLECCRDQKLPAAVAAAPLPAPASLPSNERRRASQGTRLALGCIEQALQASPFPADSLRSVFATDEGTGEVCQQMLETLATTRQVSPLLFPNSVHNAPSGYFAIAWQNREPATVVSMGLESFACGLLCAVTDCVATSQPVLLVCYDPAITSPMDELLAVREPTGSAWIISSGLAGAGAPVLASFEMTLAPTDKEVPSEFPSWLPGRWSAHGSARGLAVLGLLEAGAAGACRLALGAQLLTLRRLEPSLS